MLGSRLNVYADVNGDGIKDTLTEKYVSQITGKELSKLKDTSVSYNDFIKHIDSQKAYCYLSAGNHEFDSLVISSQPQLLGLLYIKNEGDLDDDGGEEISYVINWADNSNTNECILMSYKNNQWIELYRFDIFETMVPELPGSNIESSPLGSQLVSNTKENNKILKQQQEEYAHFKGLIRKVGKRKIEVNTLDFERIDIWQEVKLK
jgi:hypothetical protein